MTVEQLIDRLSRTAKNNLEVYILDEEGERIPLNHIYVESDGVEFE